MANPFEEDSQTYDTEDNNAKQGLLCPECKTQFDTVINLEIHYKSIHLDEKRNSNNNVQSQLILTNHLNKFIGKAKKILKTDNKNNCEAKNTSNEIQSKLGDLEYYFLLRKDQKIGCIRNRYNNDFKNTRNSNIERYIFETNKLLLRLDKLLQNMPKDLEKRKSHEMSIVNWVNDDDVRLCIFCAKSFNLSRRRTHCRLCGVIMCYDCCLFLDIDYAKNLINPVDLDASNLNNTLKVKDSSQISSNFKTNQKKYNITSLSILKLNLINSKDNEYLIKICIECKFLCDKRIQQMIDNHTRPLIITHYEKLIELQTQCDKLIPLYINMCDSLRLGESVFQLHDARELKIKTMKLGDTMDILSKEILNFEDDVDNKSYTALKNKLRLSVLQYLKKNLLGLPSLPREEELKELQEKKHNQIILELEKQSETNFENINIPVYLNSVNKIDNKLEIVLIDNGWGIEDLSIDDQVNKMDPLELQIQIIKKYIEQARKDHKYEEVNLLENNLKQLEIENFLQKNNQDLD